MKIEMFKSTPHGIRYWSVEPDYEGGGLEIEHGMYNGVIQTKWEDVEENQSGRDIEEQIDLRVESRMTSKRDIGYRENIEEAKTASGSNTLGYCRPMLAKRIDKIQNVNYGNSYLQMKYDGHRCLVTRTISGLVAYSRNGRRIATIDHILSGISIPIGCTIDGELYNHGTPLQTITSWAKRKQNGTMNLEYIVYDVVSDENYGKRYNFLTNLRLGDNARVAPTDKQVSAEQLPLLLKHSVGLGYEGLILRQLNFPYEPGKRSSGLVKVKHTMDGEFEVTDINPSVDGWAILTCVSTSGKSFTVSAPGSIRDKLITMDRKAEYIGKAVTVKYANLTKDGVPFHPVAERWRVDL